MVCRACGHAELREVFSLGELPLGFPVAAGHEPNVWIQELALRVCDRCLLVMTEHTVPEKKLAEENLYPSEGARIVTEHDERLVQDITSRVGLLRDDLIVEIGCGDGSLLNRFKKQGFNNIIGIEPALHSEKNYPYPVVNDFFTADVVARLKTEGKRPTLVLANYVIELVPRIDEFFANLAELLAHCGFAVAEVPYFIDFIHTFRIDGFAHLRCLWFTANALIDLAQRHGFRVMTIDHDPDYRGGTLRLVARKCEMGELSQDLVASQKREREALSDSALAQLRKRLVKRRIVLRKAVAALRDEGMPLCGYGGGLKASTLLNWLRLTANDLMFVADRDPHKQGRVVPIADVPIVAPEALGSLSERVAVLVLAIDHKTEVEEYLCRMLPAGSQIIHLLPELRRIIV